ncbi:response regulator transcription factor [Polaribacter sp. IC073]|uniref:response regulator transcription factor n=1 Tax=Polaribacter sp. IC073 TaxID=2508540 RepID=UPI0011BF7ED4|nr:response regulator transcription factor [Polaribacter sp. IC073]TXD48397.1 helix-turn-helix domain-containing protein [Polaribacter sp. IC073]
MINKSTIYLILLLFYLPTNAQNKDSSSLDSSYNYYADKYYENKFTDSIKAKKYATVYLEKAKKNNDTINTITGYYFLREVLEDEMIYLNYLNKLISETKKNPNKMFPTYAYLEKGNYYIIHQINDKSLENYLSAIESANSYKNDSLKYIALERVANLKTRNKQFDAARKMFLKVYHFYDNYPKFRNNIGYFSLLSNISSSYLKEKKFDSASFFNNKAINFSKLIENEKLISYSKYRQGEINYSQQNYQTAIVNLKNSIKWTVLDENYRTLSQTYNYIAKSYVKLNQKEKAFHYNLLIDSLHQKINMALPTQKSSYHFLINYYKEKEDLKNQLVYIEKLLKVDSTLNTNEKKLAQTFKNEYEIPKLNAQKEKIISELKGNLNTSKKATYAIFGLSIIILFLLMYQNRKKKILKERFKQFIKAKSRMAIPKTDVKVKEIEALNISKDIIESVLIGLDKFEKNNKFTDTKLSLKGLASHLKTNSNYLSKIINSNKNKSYSSYIRDLRIDYSIELLNNNERIRKYSIKAIAKEVGFNTTESFANAFHKKTGLKPSYYIKELSQQK